MRLGVAAAVLSASGLMIAPAATAARATPAVSRASVWSVSATPNPTTPQSTMRGVSCSASAYCVAVGTYPDTSGEQAMLAEKWNGSAWVVVSPAMPAGATAAALQAVSCSAGTTCIAVGYKTIGTTRLTLAESWNGTSWHSLPTADVSGASSNELLAISCAAAGHCLAVGQAFTKAGSWTPLAEYWNGLKWTLAPPYDPTGTSGATLSGVSCHTSTQCLAVGDSVSSSHAETALAESWNGSSWHRQSPVNPAGTISSTFVAAACPTATCFIVGEYSTAHGSVALAETWNGVQWTVQTTPSPTGHQEITVSSIACVSALACSAVGDYLTSSYQDRTLGLEWAGSAWSLKATPNGPGTNTDSLLAAVSCSAASACTAVGSYTQRTQVNLALVARWSGSAWSAQSTRSPSGAAPSQLSGVACPGTNFCLAVGDSMTLQAGTSYPLAETWNGASWTLRSPTPPPGVDEARLTADTCLSATSCLAVGWYYDPHASTTLALAYVWNGKTWTLHLPAVPTGGYAAYLAAVTCVSASVCKAVGNYDNGVLIETWNGVRWSIQSNNLGGATARLNSISCSAANACTATGSVGYTTTLALRWNGTTWLEQTTPNPNGSIRAELDGVACSTSVSCTAVGAFSNSSYANFTFAEHWNGMAWSVQTTPSPGPEANGLDSISCPTANTCIATGSYIPTGVGGGSGGGGEQPLAESWNGTSWARLSAPAVIGGEGSLASDVCRSAAICMAVGNATKAALTSVTLAERYG